ncbi:MAG: type II toxin-antitoxin system VapC family toxin [Pseudomonadota bacterium]|nr:type II toxin-antitoxin system VapC family toxin [Pseudomonadota bacterium]
MILVDTSVWVDHLRRGDSRLADLLDRGVVTTHPFVVGEIACGNLSDRSAVLILLQELPAVVAADNDEALGFIERHSLYGKGIGYVDVHLLAAVALTHDARLWTRDKRLHSVADDLGLAIRDSDVH